MNSYERRVGRLVEMRARGKNESSRFAVVITLANEIGPDAKVVMLVDLREALPLTPEERKTLATIQRVNSQRIEHVVCLIKDSPVFKMAVDQMQKESPLEQTIVRTPEEALAALKPFLNIAELTRAKQFLEEA